MNLLRFGPTVVALLVLLATFFAVGAASAATVKDKEDFSIDVGSARICFVIPTELRTADECEGLAPDRITLTKDFTDNKVAFGLVRMEAIGDAPDLAVLIVTRFTGFGASEAAQKDASDYAVGVAIAMRIDLPSGARLRHTNDVRVVKPGPLPLVRGVFDIDGLPSDTDQALLAHQVHHVVFTADGGYTVVWSGKTNVGRRLEPFADASAPTMSVAHPAGKRGEGRAEAIGKLIGIGFTVILGLIGAGIAWSVSRSRRAAPAYGYGSRYPQPYAPYPCSSPPSYSPSYAPTPPPLEPVNPWTAKPPSHGLD